MWKRVKLKGKMQCHGCDNVIKNSPHVCGGCEFAMYCGETCARRDWDATHGHHVCENTVNQWSASNVRSMIGDVANWDVQVQTKDFLDSGEPVLENHELRNKIMNDLHVNGKLFRNYIRPILKTKRLRKGVIKKLKRGFVDDKDYRGRVKQYSMSQANDILYVVDKDSETYDGDGMVKEAYNEGMEQEI